MANQSINLPFSYTSGSSLWYTKPIIMSGVTLIKHIWNQKTTKLTYTNVDLISKPIPQNLMVGLMYKDKSALIN